MKNTNFFKHFAIIGSGTFINLLLGLITTPIITRIVDPIEYGKLSIFTMYSNVALMVLCMGLDQAIVRYYYESEDIQYKRSLLFKCIHLPVIISVICSIVIIICSSTGLIMFEFNTLIIVLLCIYTIIQIIYRFSLLIIRLEYNSKLYSILSILLKLLYIIIAISLIFIIKKNYLLLLVISTVISTFISLVVSIVVESKIWNFFIFDKVKCGISKRELLRYSYPYIISMGVTTLFQTIDKISLNYFGTYADVGIYASAISLVHIFSIIQTTFNTLWSPMAMEHYSKNKDDRSFYQKANQVITIIMFFVGISLILVKDVFIFLLGEKYRAASYILPFLIFNPIMYTISETTVNGLVFMKKSKMQIIVALGACFGNIIGNIILVPILGCKGAAISTGISYILFFTLRTVLSNKYFYIDFKLKRFYLLTFFVCVYTFYNTFNSFNILSLFGYLICLFILIFMYKDTIKWFSKYLYRNIKQKLKKCKEV